MNFGNNYIQSALNEAQDACARGEVPVGAVIVDYKSGEIIARSGNRVEELADPTAHAELIAIKKACIIKKSRRLSDCDLYVTLEPCPMCAQAISFARIRRLYYGAFDSKGGGVENGARIFNASSCNYVPEIYGGLEERKSAALLKDFFARLRLDHFESRKSL